MQYPNFNQNPNYGMNYQPMNYMPNQSNNQPINSSNQDERIWVTNQSAAEAYLVASNGFVRLWDSSCNKFYEKSADYSGRPYPMKVYEYKEVTGQIPTENNDFVSKDEFTEFKNKVNEFINSFESEE